MSSSSAAQASATVSVPAQETRPQGNGQGSGPRTRSRPEPAAPAGERKARQFVTFSFFKLDPAWRHLDPETRERGRGEFLATVQEYQNSGTVVVPYSCVGLRADHDILLWRIDYQLERHQGMTAALARTGLGKYLLPSLSMLSMSKRSVYVDKINPEHEDLRTHIVPGRGKYIFVYPFVKNRDWYLLHKQTRQGIMDEHIQIGNKYPSVKLNTTYSFGIDDQDFVVAFESDHPEDFVDLVMELRETDGSRYTVRDTPIISGIKGSLADVLHTLG